MAKMNAALNPLPSFLRASAQDAANMAMRKACRAKWNEDDWNVMCETQERLIRACYGRDRDHNQPDMCFIRFSVAEQMEKRGLFNLSSDMKEIEAAIDRQMDG